MLTVIIPSLPVDYGCRNSKNLRFHKKSHIRAKLLRMRQASPESVRYATDRADEKVKFTGEALMTVQAMPCVFLPLVLKGYMDRARENGVELITAEHMQIINDKRTKEKNNPFSRKEFFHVQLSK